MLHFLYLAAVRGEESVAVASEREFVREQAEERAASVAAMMIRVVVRFILSMVVLKRLFCKVIKNK